jgi:16S rRNA (uracil1498-N3)-methyltransferase
VPPEAWRDGVFPLPPEEARHAVQVRRACAGDAIELVDGAGHRADGVIEQVNRRDAWVRITGRTFEPPPRIDLGLIASVPKGDKSDWIVEKATELGLSRIWMVETERSIARVAPERRAARVERWRRTAIEAIKQCGRARLPDLRLFDSLEDACAARGSDEPWILGALTPDTRPLRAVLEEVERAGATRAAALVGPEGDFSPGEYRRLIDAGAIPVSFGPRVLRVETAALYAAAALALYFGS